MEKLGGQLAFLFGVFAAGVFIGKAGQDLENKMTRSSVEETKLLAKKFLTESGVTLADILSAEEIEYFAKVLVDYNVNQPETEEEMPVTTPTPSVEELMGYRTVKVNTDEFISEEDWLNQIEPDVIEETPAGLYDQDHILEGDHDSVFALLGFFPMVELNPDRVKNSIRAFVPPPSITPAARRFSHFLDSSSMCSGHIDTSKEVSHVMIGNNKFVFMIPVTVQRRHLEANLLYVELNLNVIHKAYKGKNYNDILTDVDKFFTELTGGFEFSTNEDVNQYILKAVVGYIAYTVKDK
jgi:hypothetical protein